MGARCVRALGGVLAILAVLAACERKSETGGPCRARLVALTDLKPEGYGLHRVWHGMGMDREQRVYVGISTGAELEGGPGDVLIFRYDPRTGERRFLKSLRQVLAEEGNLGPNAHWPKPESVAKVHSDIFEHNGLLYFATHDWHVFEGLDRHRGGHFISFDPRTGRFRDLSKSEPLGVSVLGQGIIAMNVLRARNQLVGWTFPLGDVLIHDLRSGTTTRYGAALPPERVTNVARVVVATETGEVFASYSPERNPEGGDALYKVDRSAGRLEPTGQRFSGRKYVEGLAELSNGSRIYLATADGELHVFDVQSEHLEHLGSMLPEEHASPDRQVAAFFNLALSPDERKLFTLPHSDERGGPGYHLFEYDVETGARTDLGDCSALLRGSAPTGNGVFDEDGRYYLAYSWEDDDRAGILQVDVADRLLPTAAVPKIAPYGGGFSDSVVVSLASQTPGATIHYTIDGSDPTPESPPYAAPLTLREGGQLKARALAAGLEKSPVARATFFEDGSR